MGELILVCDSCGTRMKIPASAVGRKGVCPNPECRSTIVVSEANTVPCSSPDRTAGTRQPPSEEAFEAKCPRCGNPWQIMPSWVGKRARCTECGQRVTVPGPPQAESRAPTPPAPPVDPSSPAPPSSPSVAPAQAPPPPPPVAPAPRPPSPPTGAPVGEIPTAPVPVPVSTAPLPAEAEVYPWDPSPELAARAEAHDRQGNYTLYRCMGAEYLNTLLKLEAFRGLTNHTDLRVYPDLVSVEVGEEGPGCVPKFLQIVPEWLVGILEPVLCCFAFLVLSPGSLMAALCGTAAMLIVVSAAAMLIFYLWYIMIPALILLLAAAWLVDYLNRRRIAKIVQRIRSDPTSPYAVKKMYEYAPLLPRYWQRGDVVQLVRVDTRFRVRRRALVLIVQDNVLPARGGCLATGVGVFIGRKFRPERRVYVLSFRSGEAEANDAVATMGTIFGVAVDWAKFRFNNLRLERGPERAS